MIWLFIFFSIIHVLFFTILAFKWKRINHEVSAEELGFSVLIPVRNEAQTIRGILECLSLQEYPKSKFEIIVIDDFSEDDTIQVLTKASNEFAMPVRVISLKNELEKGKKHAISRGVEASRFDYIITTDADCKMGPHWISSYSKYFENNKMLAGPVSIEGASLFSRLQQLEFAGLIGFGAVTIEADNPSMCSGANLGFSKDAFIHVEGYQNNIHLPSGDDEFLLYNILKRYPGAASFIKDQRAVVTTQPHASLASFINQRTRWTSKWKHHKNWKLQATAVLFFMDYFSILILYLGMIFGWFDLLLGIIFLGLRFVAEAIFILSINQFMGNKGGIVHLLALQFIYPFHVLLMGLKSIFGNYTWKGRTY